MLLIVIRILYACVCIGAIMAYVNITYVEDELTRPSIVTAYPLGSFFVLLLISQTVTLVDIVLRRKRIEVVSAVYIGLLVGVLLAFLFVQAMSPLIPESSPFHTGAVMITMLVFPYICISLLLQTKDDFRFIIPYVEFARDLKGGHPLVVDSSSLIDGRIFDVVETGILESQLIVPDFVLNEVQDIADSSDKIRRSRGRRGLEILSKLQNSPHGDIKMQETKSGDYRGMTVDQKIVELAKHVQAGVITNDFNLNKVAGVQGIAVINLNDVANALKPRYIPGERLRIKILKEGESQGQGVGYLDDGTMVVCEQASHLMGKDVDSIVTSVLQSSAGRMIFAKIVFHPKSDEEA